MRWLLSAFLGNEEQVRMLRPALGLIRLLCPGRTTTCSDRLHGLAFRFVRNHPRHVLITCTLKLKQIRHCVRASAFQIGMEIQHHEVVFVLHFLPFLPWFELFLLYAVFSYSMLLCPLRGMSVLVLYGWVQHIYLFFNSFVHFILAVTNTSFPFQRLAGWGS